jgi:hypothetical protein
LGTVNSRVSQPLCFGEIYGWCREGVEPQPVVEIRKLLIAGIDRIAQIATTDIFRHNSGTMRCKVAAFASSPAKTRARPKAMPCRGACRQRDAGVREGARSILGDFTYPRSLRWSSARVARRQCSPIHPTMYESAPMLRPSGGHSPSSDQRMGAIFHSNRASGACSLVSLVRKSVNSVGKFGGVSL